MKKVLILTALLLVLLCVVSTPLAFAQNNGVRQAGQGKYARMTAHWWQWILEQPTASNPNLDSTGADAANGQPGGGVFFLAGAFGGTVTRTFTVPRDAALFFALLNNVGLAPHPAPQPKPDQNQVPQLRALIAPLVVNATGLHVTLDGVSLLGSVKRVKSPVFHFTSPADGLLGAGAFTAVSDGYWLYLKPLAPGTHVLHFGGTSGDFMVDITDTITVQ